MADKRTGYCEMCGKEKSRGQFYTDNSEKTSVDYYPLCKSCIKKQIYNSSNGFIIVDEVKNVLRKMRLPFIQSVYNSALKDDKETFGIYIKNLNPYFKSHGIIDEYKEINDVDEKVKDSNLLQNNQITNNTQVKDIEDDGIELEMLKDKWGDTLPKEQLVWMDRQYKKWENDYAINNELDDTIVEQIIFEKWYIQQERQQGHTVDKRIETMNKLLKQGNFKKRSNEDSEIDSIATYISEWEKGKPFLKENDTPEFKDPDNFIKLAEVLAGAIARTIGRSNSYTDKFEEYYKNSTMDLTNLNSDDASNEVGETNDNQS